MAKILCVGIATLDVVNQVPAYPAEDSEVRASAQRVSIGGNAANTARVLSYLGAQTHWLGNLSDDAAAQQLIESFRRTGVDHALAQRIPNSRLPTSYITLSGANGSRSIVHYRDLPEYDFAHFSTLDLRFLDWVHFEGRPVEQLAPMLNRVRQMCGLPLSLEVEKPRPGIEALFEEADVLMFSRDYVRAQGVEDPEQWLERLPPGNMASCTWGEQGAWLRDFAGDLHQHQPVIDAPVIDTLAAGDVFNAGLLDAITRGVPASEALREAVQLAAQHCTQEGLLGL